MEVFATDRGEPEAMVVQAQRLMEQVRHEAMFLIDRVGRVASWNEGVGAILGWSSAEWIGQPLQVMFTPEDVRAGAPQAEMMQAAANGRCDDSRWLCRRSGERFFALGALTPMRDDEGRLVGYFKALRDLTPAKRAEEALEQLLVREDQARSLAESQTAYFSAAIEVLAEGVLIGDLHGVQRCNAAALDMLGARSLQDFQAEPLALVERFGLRSQIGGPLLDADAMPFGRVFPAEPQALELWARHALTGRNLQLRCAVSPISVGGRAAGVVVVLSDLSSGVRLPHGDDDLSALRRKVKARDADIRTLVKSLGEHAIFTLDTGGRIASWHRGAQLMKGYSKAEAVGMPFANLFSAADQASGRPAAELALAVCSGEFTGEGHRVRKDGSTFDAAVVLTALRDTHGELLGFINLTQDITPRRELERQRDTMLREADGARDEARRLSHSKGEFLATISHELRTPLSAILGWAHVLERGMCDFETVQQGLSAISRNARLQVQLIEDLLDMNRIESGQLQLDVQHTELGGVIAAAVDSALPQAAAKGIGLRAVLSPGGDAVLGDPVRLKQVLGILLGNAIRFTPVGGQVSVTRLQGDGLLQLSVTDTGQGIEPELLALLFNRFQQQATSTASTTMRRHGGMGIGLALVRSLVQLHGGTVRAESPGLGKGATFTVWLPQATTRIEAQSGAAQITCSDHGQNPGPRAVVQRLDGITVLLVDDEPDLRSATARVLQGAGAQVIMAAGAAEALQELKQRRPSVIVSDIGMPQVDGYELLRQVRQLPEAEGGRTPAAAYSAFTRPDDATQALAAGFQRHLSKPLAPAALIAAILCLVRGE